MLSYRGVAPEQTLRKALTDLEGRSFHEECGQGSALRAVLKVAIAYNYTLMDPQSAFASPVPANDGNLAAQILAALPRYERAVYFLSEILYCSRHDTALLLGISDSNVDQLVEFAKKRNRVYG
jgi:DNA-directed RNA polymerase specialized sigma24 family protein